MPKLDTGLHLRELFVFATDANNITTMYSDSQACALKEIPIQRKTGRVFALPSRNGAGKTTSVCICIRQLVPSDGSVRVPGLDTESQAGQVRTLVSIVSQKGRPLRALTPWDHVYYNWLRLRGSSKIKGTRSLRAFTYESVVRELSSLVIKKNLLFTISPIGLDDTSSLW